MASNRVGKKEEISEQDIKDIREMFHAGYSLRQIAKLKKIHRNLVEYISLNYMFPDKDYVLPNDRELIKEWGGKLYNSGSFFYWRFPTFSEVLQS